MRSVPGVVAVSAGVGLVLVAEAAHRTGTVPLGRPTDALQVIVGAALMAVSAGTTIVISARRGHIKVVLAAGLGAAVVLLTLPYVERAIFGPDPGFVLRTFETFEWSPAARFVLFPSLREISVLVAFAAGVGAVLRLVRPAAESVRP